MDYVQALHNIFKPTHVHCFTRNSNTNEPHHQILLCKTPTPKPSSQKLLTRPQLSLKHQSIPQHAHHQDTPNDHTTLLVESFHHHRMINALKEKLQKKGSCPLMLLQEYGDWSKEQFWAVIRYLRNFSRTIEILQVFDVWKSKEKSRINKFNYEKIIGLLSDEGLIEDATSAFVEMKRFGLNPSLQMYNSIINVYAANGKFDDALKYLNEMKEFGLPPESDTYDGLIRGYGKYKMYDEMGMCLKKMDLDGCSPDGFSYNLLIQELARGGLLSRMERVYQSMRTKRMDAHTSTLIAMLEAYANFGIVEKMEKVLTRLHNTGAILEEDLIRKIASVYIGNYMFSRLEELADDLTSKIGKTDIIWCLHLLSHAFRLSQKGLDSVIIEMKEEEYLWNVTVANIVLLACLKMKNFTQLRFILSNLLDYQVKPDMVTFGVLLDACNIGFDATTILESWRRKGLLYRSVEMNTDPLVIAAFGKGEFLVRCENVFSSLEPEIREKKTWTYFNFIELVARHH